MTYVFGPVASRRLGRSLGVDLIPFKTCTFDCVYCQLGPTPARTTDIREWFSLDAIIRELKEKLDSQPDYIALGGSGEPTLYARIGELIDRIHRITEIPVAVITNGSLLSLQNVRRALVKADVVMPSLDAGDEETYRLINRPHEKISFDRLIDGLVRFRQEYRGQYWLEVLLLSGINDSREEVGRIAAMARKIGPDRVQLNTCVRPGADPSARIVSRGLLAELAALFDPPAEVIADFRDETGTLDRSTAGRAELLDMLARHPSTAEDLAAALRIDRQEASTRLEELAAEGLVKRREADDGVVHYLVATRE